MVCLFVPADAPARDKVQLLAAVGEQLGWGLPVGRVLVRHSDGRQLWGILLKLYDGDIDVRLSLLLLFYTIASAPAAATAEDSC